MKLWVDDLRSPAEGTWTIARTYDAAETLLFCGEFEFSKIALDNDLGDERPTREGKYLLRYLIAREMQGGLPCPYVTILTNNPVARQDMETSLRILHKWRSRQ